MNRDAPRVERPRTSPSAPRWILGGLIGLLAVALIAHAYLRRPGESPPPEVARDPSLARGREIFLERCISCHGPSGRGDGPLAGRLSGQPPRNLAEERWRHGDRPEQVLAVLADGVKDTQMPAWAGTYGPADLKAVAAYLFHLAGRPIPDTLRP